MENCLLNNEEQKILDDLSGLPELEKIRILEDSLADEPDDSGRRVLRTLILKLKASIRKGQGLP